MHFGLGFALLAGATLATGCSDAGSTGQSSVAVAETSAGTTAGPPTTAFDGTADPATSGTTPTGVDTGPTTSGTTTGTSEWGTTAATDSSTGEIGDTPPIGPDRACQSGCVVEFMCGMEWASERECVQWCEANLEKADAFSPFCHDAWAGVSACLGTLTCEEFAEWDAPAMFPYPCSEADVVLEVECKGQ